MQIYFVRHGQTAANAAKRYQGETEPLTRTGSSEVAQLVKTIELIKPTHLYTSPLTRARQTADFLSYATGLEASWLECVKELTYPAYMHGRRHYSLMTAIYGLRWFFDSSYVDLLPDAENRHELFARIKEAQRYFIDNHGPEDRVVVVSHSFYISGVVMHLCRDTPMKLHHALPHALRVLRYKNSGVTHVSYDHNAPEGTCAWSLNSFADDTHLAT